MVDKNLKLGLCGTSFKDNEFRLPIHPQHLANLDSQTRENLFLEEGYGEGFGISPDFLKQHIKNIVPRQVLFEQCDAIVLLKPTKHDFRFFQENQIILGWLDCRYYHELNQVGINKKMTFIALEFMYFWQDEKTRTKHIFDKNNELGGYCSVWHSLEVLNMARYNNTSKPIAILGFGNTTRGAISALDKLGYKDITIFTRRQYHDLKNPISGVNYYHYNCVASPDSKNYVIPMAKNQDYLLVKELANYDIIINCINQEHNAVVKFICNQQLKYFKPGTIIIDVSLDLPMAFEFGKFTSFSEPFFEVGTGVIYYGVDNSPSYLWQEATYQVSKAFLPYVKTIMAGEETWKKDLTIWNAIDIKNGIPQNPALNFF
jgi:alanine dehydrogenase